MKVIFCDNALDSFLNFRGPIAKHFHDIGHDVVLVVPEEQSLFQKKVDVPEYIKLHHIEMTGHGTNPLSDIRYYRCLKKIFKQERPDIVFTYTIKPNIYGSVAAKKFNIPVVSMIAGLGYVFKENDWRRRLARRMYRYGLKHSDRVILLNRSNSERLLREGFVQPRQLILFEGGEGVDMNKFAKVQDPYSSVRFLMVARLLYDKGYKEYVEAAKIIKKQYPETIFEILGPMADDSAMGVPKEVLQADCDAGHISYLGETDDVPSFLRKPGTVIVIASKYLEGLNRALMEACSMGRICITTNNAGCREAVDDGISGYIVECGDSTQLADKMKMLIEASPAKREQMAEMSYCKAKNNFDINLTIEHYVKIMDELGLS